MLDVRAIPEIGLYIVLLVLAYALDHWRGSKGFRL